MTQEELDQERTVKGEFIETFQPLYETRALAVLNAMRKALMEADFRCSDAYFSGYDCEWQFQVYVSGTEEELQDDDIDISLRFDMSEECDGTPDGLAIAVRVAAVGGAIIGGLHPYNYTDQVFVDRDDLEGVDDRFSIFETADPHTVVKLVQEWADR